MTPFDPTAAITAGVTALESQVMGIIAVVAPVAIAIVGAIIAIRKGISVFRSLVGR